MNYQPMTIPEIHAALDRFTWTCFALAVVTLTAVLVWDGSDPLMFLGCSLCLLGAFANVGADYLDRKHNLERAFTRGKRLERTRYPAL